MTSRLFAVSSSVLLLVAASSSVAGGQPSHGDAWRCGSGARSLSHLGDHVYPEAGNGGYTSLHTDVHLAYDAPSNRFLPGNHVVLTDSATQCLSDFSLDFERHSAANPVDGPDLTVQSITVNGRPASFRFVEPTYPGDPNGQDDPDPRAHQASQVTPVGGPNHNPLPPACTPEVTGDDVNAQNGDPCPANKLVITPRRPLRAGEIFRVTVNYTGRPGVHTDGDGSTEGWFRSDSPAGDGGFVTTEPVGTEDWMPLNNHPSAKPTYDFYDTVNAGRTAVANGVLLSSVPHSPDAGFPGGSTTFHWHSSAPVASYLVQNSVGAFDLTSRVGSDGIRYYEVQGSSISAAQKQANLAIMDQQQDITAFQSQFNGRFPFTSNGVLVGVPSAGFEEEMQTMITFEGGRIGLRTFHHENFHQWWGDNVTEANYDLTFFKEGMATLGEYLFVANTAQTAAGGPSTAAGRAAFEASLVNQFNTNYASNRLWTGAPSDPTPATLFSGSFTYTRPGTAYLALRQILGATNFTRALQRIQRDYGGRSITEKQLEAEFHRFMPNRSHACSNRLDQFFAQWFDTAYPAGGGANRPQLTGPGLTGPGFYDADGRCS
jgi:aminopeptidase N